MSDAMYSVFLNPGAILLRTGYILQTQGLLGADAPALERRFGMGPGRLSEGWYWLVLVEAPRDPTDFQVMGSTLYPDGAVPEGGPHFDDLARLRVAGHGDIRQGMVDFWPLRGPYRFMKAVPCIPHTDDATYPAATERPILQIKLLRELRFRVVRRVGPDERLDSGSAEWRAALELQA